MPIINDCLAFQVKSGKVSQQAVDDYLRRLNDAKTRARHAGMEGLNADMYAASTTAVEMVESAKNRRAEVVQQILSVDRVWEAAGQHSVGRFHGLLYALGENWRGEARSPNALSVVNQSRAVYGALQRLNADFIEQARSKIAGLKRDVETPVHVVRELYDESSGSAMAKSSADGWGKSIDYALDLLRAAGVKVKAREDWRLPQKFDPLVVRRAGKDGFVAQMESWWREGKLRLRDWASEGEAYLIPGTKRTLFSATPEVAPDHFRLYRGEGDITGQAFTPHSPLTGRWFTTELADAHKFAAANPNGRVYYVDLHKSEMNKLIADAHQPNKWFATTEDIAKRKQRFVDAIAGEGVADETRVRDILNKAFDNITSDAGSSLEPGVYKLSTLSERYGRRRAFEWADSNAWLEFNKTFGVGEDGVFELMVKHLKHLANDVALAQVLGPDPKGAQRTLLAMASREGLSAARVRFLENVYMQSSGIASSPVSENFATLGQNMRNWLTAFQLGGAVLSAVTDFGFIKLTTAWNGLSSSRLASNYLAGLNPANREHRLLAARQGLIQEVGLRTLADGARDSMSDVAARLPGRVAEFVMRAQGLMIHTQSARDAFGLEFQAMFADLAKRSFDNLDSVHQRTLRTYGISPTEWDLLRTKGIDTPNPEVAPFLNPAKLAIEGTPAERAAALKFLGAVAAEQRYAVPEGNTLSRALLLGQSQPGTIGGEFRRSLAQYKSFPTSVMLMHLGRAMDDIANSDGSWLKGRYLAGLIVMTTSLGALAINLKNIASGKDAEDMAPDDPVKAMRFWGRAMLQGGGAGIFGDFLQTAVSRRSGTDIAGAFAGPTFSAASDVASLIFGNVGQYYRDEKMNFGREAVKMANRYTPDLWYTRLAMDRLVWDTVQRWADPDYHESFRRMEERARKDQGLEYWWRPGASEPRRAPRIPQLETAR